MFDRFLAYGTAGAAWGDVDHSFSTTNAVNTFTEQDDNGVWDYQSAAASR